MGHSKNYVIHEVGALERPSRVARTLPFLILACPQATATLVTVTTFDVLTLLYLHLVSRRQPIR